jgi:LmbE family N-acetylglucosaminyl deacetylase
MTLTKPTPAAIDTALEALTDTRLTVDDRAAAYGVIHQVQLRLNRALRKVKDELIEHMERNHLKALGPLSIKSTAIDVAWPCNDEGNWMDATIQGALMDVYARLTPEFVKHIPDHYEIDTRALGEAVHLGDPAAQQLHQELKDRHWRTEVGRRLSLNVREVKVTEKEEAA